MKKVLCLIESLGSGGAERQMTGLACMLKGKGMDVVVTTYDTKDFYKNVLDEHGIKTAVASKSSSLLIRLIGIHNNIRSEKADVVISYSRASSIIACLERILGKKYKLIVSERNTTQALGKFERLKFFFYKYADLIVPNSFSQEAFIKNNYPNLAPKVRVITNFVETDLFVPLEKKEYSHLVKILVVARVSEQKNVLNFIKAMKLVYDKQKDVLLEWYGSQSHKDYFTNCKKLVSELELDEVISFKQPTTSILNAYQEADIFCLPSIYEGYPNVICEAMSVGLPIVCSNVCDNPIIVKDGENGFLFDPKSVQNIADAICRMLLLEEEQRLIIGKTNRYKMIKENSIEEFCKKYIDAINVIE